MAESATWILEELCTVAQQEVERRRFPNPGGKVGTTLNARTVRYYTTLGLVDRPAGYEGGAARYHQRHLLQLLAIKALQAQFLPLPEIQRRLYGQSDIELQQVVDSESREAPALPAVTIWQTCQPLPGLRLLVEDRTAMLDWLRSHSNAELLGQIQQALTLLHLDTKQGGTPWQP